MENGCICCTLGESMLNEIAECAKDFSIEYLIIESTGIGEPRGVAETIALDNEELEFVNLRKVARLDTTVTVIDAAHFKQYYNCLETVNDS